MGDPPLNTGYNVIDGAALAWATVLAFIPKLVGFILVLIIGYIVAMAVGKILDKALTKMGFDRLLDRNGIKRAMAESGYHPSDIIGKIVFYTLMLFTLEIAFGLFGPNPVSDLLNRIIAFLPNIFVAIAIIIVAATIATAVRDIVRASLGGLSYGRILASLAGISIVAVGVFAALTQLNIAPAIVVGVFYAMLAAVVGILIVAVGGGGIMPMRQRWDSALNRLDDEVPKVRDQVRTAQIGQTAATSPSATPVEPNTGYLG